MRAVNIWVSNTQSHIKPVHDWYKDSLNNILPSNIDDIVAKIVHIKLELLRQGASITQPCMPQNDNVLQLSKIFGQADSKVFI